MLTIENLGSVSADDVSVDVEPIGQGEPPAVLLEDPIERLPAHSSVRVLIAVSFGTAARRVTIRWKEGSHSFSEVQSVTMF